MSKLKRFILTGTPGAGKTALIRALEVSGFAVVEEAATDVIALAMAQGVERPETLPDFIDRIVDLQARRQGAPTPPGLEVQIFDRSPICTFALATHLGRTPSARLRAEIERLEAQAVYQRRVGFIRTLGFVTPTAARRIGFEDALRFEETHLETYARFGYECALIAPAALPDRLARLCAALGLGASQSPPPEDRPA